MPSSNTMLAYTPQSSARKLCNRWGSTPPVTTERRHIYQIETGCCRKKFLGLGFDILCFYMAFQPVPVPRRSLRKHANVLEHPLEVVRTLCNKDGCAEREPTMEAYTEAANKCIDSATTFLDHARHFVEAKRAYELWQKESDLGRVRKEISALKLVISLLEEPAVACQTEPLSSDSYVAPSCTEPVIPQCADFAGAICSSCQTLGCSKSFCEACGKQFVTSETRSEPAISHYPQLPPTRPA
jgi:hypothetical protein